MMSWILLVSLATTSPAEACGGPDRYSLYDIFIPAQDAANGWLYPYDGWETTIAPTVRFLEPLAKQHPEEFSALYNATYGRYGDEARPEAKTVDGAFWAAIATPDRAKWQEAANIIVKAALDRPAALAPADDAELRAAVEYLELLPNLTSIPVPELQAYFGEHRPGNPTAKVLLAALELPGTTPATAAVLLKKNPKHPRAASLRLKILQDQFHSRIPNGWDANEIREKLTPDAGLPLFAEIDAWLKDYPSHPMADYVKLYKLRLFYLYGQGDNAWKLLFEEYPKHPARIAAEMRFLLVNGPGPTPAILEGAPGEVVASLIHLVPLTDAEWTHWWRYSEAHLGEPWALSLQERLLAQRALDDSRTLPEGFPAEVAAPTPEWATLRLLVLAKGNNGEALAQSAVCTVGPAATLRAGLLFGQNDIIGAIEQPGVKKESQRYLIRIVASDEDLAVLRKSSEPWIQAEATRETAARLAAANDWKGAAQLMGPSWDGVAKAAKKGRKDPLTWARYIHGKRGELFASTDVDELIWYRSLGDTRYPGLEQDWVKRSFEESYALQGYAAALSAVPDARIAADPEKWMTVVQEADKSYNYLLNYGNSDTYVWGEFIASAEEGQIVRHAGKVARTALTSSGSSDRP